VSDSFRRNVRFGKLLFPPRELLSILGSMHHMALTIELCKLGWLFPASVMCGPGSSQFDLSFGHHLNQAIQPAVKSLIKVFIEGLLLAKSKLTVVLNPDKAASTKNMSQKRLPSERSYSLPNVTQLTVAKL
jgi:hypothetical protein